MEDNDKHGLKTHRSKDIEFTTGIPRDSFTRNYEQYLYNTPEFIKVSSRKEPILFSVIDSAANSILAQCNFTLKDKNALSPEIGPFGSIEMDSSVHEKMLMDFISFFEKQLHLIGGNKVIIKSYASFQSIENSLKLQKAFSTSGYKTKSIDINHHIVVSKECFSSFIHPMEKRRLEKCKKEGMVIRQAETDELELVHEFINNCRKERKLEINIDKQQFLKAIEVMPEHYHVFIGLINREIAAATVCVSVNSSILYNYLPASAEKFKSFSPVIMIMESVYDFAERMKYKYIDLGISSIAGKPQPGLITFKERIGGIYSQKITYSKSLAG